MEIEVSVVGAIDSGRFVPISADTNPCLEVGRSGSLTLMGVRNCYDAHFRSR